jgi:pimeloyl-ACP methyl ester carboxylesterase
MELNYKEFGEGQPLVVLHGLFGTLDNWQTLAREWAAHYTVIVVDLPNHGRSFQSDARFDYRFLADTVHDFLQSKWIYSAKILGHSMGGKTAMQLALEYPDMVEKLVVVDIAPKTYPSGHDEVFEALFAIDLTTLQDRKTAEQILMDKLKGDVGTVQFILKNLSRIPSTEGGGFEWKMNLNVLYRDYSYILHDVEMAQPFNKPSLFIRGGNSNYVQDDDFGKIKQLFPAADLKTIPDAGHWVHADKPKELSNMVLSFLEN